jgi:hypothetical protein
MENTVISFFGKENTTILKDGKVLKVICDLENTRNNSIKINFYKTGAVVIQRAKCSQFYKLKNKVDNKEQEYTEENKPSKSTKTKFYKISLDSSITFAKTKCEEIEAKSMEVSSTFHKYFSGRLKQNIQEHWETESPPGYLDKRWTNNNSE